MELREVNKDNWYLCAKLEVTDEQKLYFPCPVVNWIAESKYEHYFIPLAICDGDQIVGFLVNGLDPDDNQYCLYTFLIDKRYQGRGYGRSALDEFIKKKPLIEVDV